MALSIKSLTGLRFSCHDLFSCFSLKTNYHYILQYPKINQPGPSHIEKICFWTKFQAPTCSWIYQEPFSSFGQKTNYPDRWHHPKINQPGLNALKKYASGPSFSLMHGSWLYRAPFSSLSQKINYPDWWRHPKINQPGLHAPKYMPLDQVSASYMFLALSGPVFLFEPKKTAPMDGAIQK